MNNKVDYLFPNEEYNPKTADFDRIKNYVDVSPTGCEGKAHERDILALKPEVIAPTELKRESVSMDDVSNFPKQKIVDLLESRPYEEGRYRPPSMPAYGGIFPTHVYLSRGKMYDWCSCGACQTGPFCDGQCKWVLTRNRPISFNVSESGYYKLCNCKMSANAPFCNGTHQHIWKWANKNHRGFWGIWGVISFWSTFGYWMFTFYR